MLDAGSLRLDLEHAMDIFGSTSTSRSAQVCTHCRESFAKHVAHLYPSSHCLACLGDIDE